MCMKQLRYVDVWVWDLTPRRNPLIAPAGERAECVERPTGTGSTDRIGVGWDRGAGCHAVLRPASSLEDRNHIKHYGTIGVVFNVCLVLFNMVFGYSDVILLSKRDVYVQGPCGTHQGPF